MLSRAHSRLYSIDAAPGSPEKAEYLVGGIIDSSGIDSRMRCEGDGRPRWSREPAMAAGGAVGR